jgi:hypothetical protein
MCHLGLSDRLNPTDIIPCHFSGFGNFVPKKILSKKSRGYFGVLHSGFHFSIFFSGFGKYRTVVAGIWVYAVSILSTGK